MATEEINTALEALSKIDASIAGMQESVKKGEAAQCEQICGREIVKRADSNALCESVDTVPAAVKTWVLLTVTDLYEKRGASESPVATGRRFYDHLLDGYRTF